MKFILLKLQKYKVFRDFLNEETFGQFVRYLVTGLTTFAIEFGLFYIFNEYLKVHYLLSFVIVYTSVFWVNFLVNRFWSFKSSVPIKKQLLQYAILFAINLILSYFLLKVLVSNFEINKYISKVIQMFAVVSWNFILYKKVIYR